MSDNSSSDYPVVWFASHWEAVHVIWRMSEPFVVLNANRGSGQVEGLTIRQAKIISAFFVRRSQWLYERFHPG